MGWMLEGLAKAPLVKASAGRSWNWRYSRNQNAMFALPVRVKRPHHQARGLDRACRSNLMLHSIDNRTGYDRTDMLTY
jgi:hypothetical protein